MSQPQRPPFLVPPENTATLTALVKQAAELSNRQARELIEREGVTVDGKTITDPVHRPEGGAKINLLKAGPRRRRQIDGPGFRGVHLDPAFLVVNKDPGIVVIPTGRDDPEDLPLVGRVASALKLAGHRSDPLWVVHRIDRATSGLVLLARTEAASRSLEVQFRDRAPRREYLAWTQGVPEEAKGRLVHQLLEDEFTHRVEVSRNPTAGKQAILDYQVDQVSDTPWPCARLRVELVTGRRNQVRAQLAASGWPLIGDRWYNPACQQEGQDLVDRAALHAARLGFRHPLKNTPLAFDAPLPKDLKALDDALFQSE